MKTITTQQVVDHAKFLIHEQVNLANSAAKQYTDQTGKLTWISAFNIVSERNMKIRNIAFVLGTLLGSFSHHEMNRIADSACAELDSLQDEMREFMNHNIHTAG